MVKSAWHDTTFDAGDRVTFELEEHGAAKPTVVEWIVSDAYVEYDEMHTYVEDGHLRLSEQGGLINDYANENGIRLFIGGAKNIFPKNFRVLDKNEVVIDRSVLVPIEPEDLKLGDRIVVENAQGTYTIDFELTEKNFESFETLGLIFGGVDVIIFPSNYGDDKLLGKYV